MINSLSSFSVPFSVISVFGSARCMSLLSEELLSRLIIMDSDTLHAHSAGFESWSKQCHTLLNRVMSPKSLNGWKSLVTSTVLGTFAIGRREWIPSCLASFQISLETDENGGTSSGYFVIGLVSSTIQLRSWTRQQVHIWRAWGTGPGSQRDGQSVVHESSHGVQERGPGCCENCDSRAWL